VITHTLAGYGLLITPSMESPSVNSVSTNP